MRTRFAACLFALACVIGLGAASARATARRTAGSSSTTKTRRLIGLSEADIGRGATVSVLQPLNK